MTDVHAQIKQANDQLKRATEDLEIWESFESVTVTEGTAGKVINVRSQMIARCKHNMQVYRGIIAALERRAEKSN